MFMFTIITVCYNAANEIGRTIESVLSQTYNDFEYLIIDGNSQDNTVRIAEKYSGFFEQKGISYKISSEPDKGIYDAMNKGARKAQGDWLIFMNAGDTFYNEKVLKSVSTVEGMHQYDVIYGDTLMKDGDMYKYVQSKKLDKIAYGLPFVHQSAFTNIRVFQNYEYNEKYKICADFELYLKLYLEGCKFKYLPSGISVFSIGGVSTCSNQQLKDEMISILQQRSDISKVLIDEVAMQLDSRISKNKIKHKIKELCPQFVRQYVHVRNLKKTGWTRSRTGK